MDIEEVRKLIKGAVTNQPKAWQELWEICGMLSPSSEFKTLIRNMAKNGEIKYKRMYGVEYYYAK